VRDLAARRRHFRQQAARNVQQAQQFVVPAEIVDVEQQRARALETSVTCRAPSVSCQISQLSTVPKASSPRSARARAPS
jgi:hypothetical protein